MSDEALYIHIPYCRSKCGYCDFCSSPDLSTVDAYVAELIRRVKAYKTDKTVKSVYFGGGTPTYIGAERLCEILRAVKENHTLSDDCEITAEANPGTVGLRGLEMMRKAGFNRLSAGIQTANEKELKALGRVSHTVKDGETLVKNARNAGFENISLDLMYGIPGQTPGSLDESLDFVISLMPEHISAYALRLEENTPLYKQNPVLPDDDTVADMYAQINKKLKANGYERYEISNFAKPGYESRHNLRYWEGGDYLGVGVSAASLYGDVRYLQSSDMSSFLSGKEPDTVETLDEDGKKLEYIMLHLRLAKGVCKAEFKEKFGYDFDTEYQSRIKKYGDHGFAVNTEKNFYLTEKGLLVSNAIISDFIY
jgi:oxygen-independent coproporphyrinogen-3 oxidase